MYNDREWRDENKFCEKKLILLLVDRSVICWGKDSPRPKIVFHQFGFSGRKLCRQNEFPRSREWDFDHDGGIYLGWFNAWESEYFSELANWKFEV